MSWWFIPVRTYRAGIRTGKTRNCRNRPFEMSGRSRRRGFSPSQNVFSFTPRFFYGFPDNIIRYTRVLKIALIISAVLFSRVPWNSVYAHDAYFYTGCVSGNFEIALVGTNERVRVFYRRKLEQQYDLYVWRFEDNTFCLDRTPRFRMELSSGRQVFQLGRSSLVEWFLSGPAPTRNRTPSSRVTKFKFSTITTWRKPRSSSRFGHG